MFRDFSELIFHQWFEQVLLEAFYLYWVLLMIGWFKLQACIFLLAQIVTSQMTLFSEWTI